MFIGIDPDLHDLAIGYWKNGHPHYAEVIHVPRKKGVIEQAAVMQMVRALASFDFQTATRYADGIAVEAQTLKRSGPKQHKRPQDIVTLGNVGGAVLALAMNYNGRCQISFPTPQAWKGQIPKAVMQARLYNDLGWGYEMLSDYARPTTPTPAFSHISAGQWKHVGDALLLARWAEQQYGRTK